MWRDDDLGKELLTSTWNGQDLVRGLTQLTATQRTMENYLNSTLNFPNAEEIFPAGSDLKNIITALQGVSFSSPFAASFSHATRNFEVV